ncbi:hypothetical protein M569_05430 [Genlisea aurea]|uniref:Uncharacterized protein n=1 Tax=Genlisea aurea TaxID=192259 RepID=S8CWQ1_9LAMI|nr:hypothetical protein M569_05430 [Genlisea aurea]
MAGLEYKFFPTDFYYPPGAAANPAGETPPTKVSMINTNRNDDETKKIDSDSDSEFCRRGKIGRGISATPSSSTTILPEEDRSRTLLPVKPGV